MTSARFAVAGLAALAVAGCYKSSVRFDATTAPVLLGQRDAIGETGPPPATHASLDHMRENVNEGSYAYRMAGRGGPTVFAFWRRRSNVLDGNAMAHLEGRSRGAIRNLRITATVTALPSGGSTSMNVSGDVIEYHGPVAPQLPRSYPPAFHPSTPADAEAMLEQRQRAMPTDPADRRRWVVALGFGPGVSWNQSSPEFSMQLWGGWTRRNLTLGAGFVGAIFRGSTPGDTDDIQSEAIMPILRWHWLRGAFVAGGIGAAISHHVKKTPGEKYVEGWGFYTATGYELRLGSWFGLAAEAYLTRVDTPLHTGATWGGMLTSLFYFGGN